VPCKFDSHDLRAQTNTEVGDVVFSRILAGDDHTFDTSLAKAAGDTNAVVFPQNTSNIVCRE